MRSFACIYRQQLSVKFFLLALKDLPKQVAFKWLVQISGRRNRLARQMYRQLAIWL